MPFASPVALFEAQEVLKIMGCTFEVVTFWLRRSVRTSKKRQNAALNEYNNVHQVFAVRSIDG